ncbi:MAG: hypothetical protein Q8S21_02055, partial [Candidatus Paracaedibacteraceae bacterium]|nr:hypothetical protein [Candidatus Paracaedibacteraceae bacterium]
MSDQEAKKKDKSKHTEKKKVLASSASSDPASSSNASNYNALGYQVDPRTGKLTVTIAPPSLPGFFGTAITPSLRYVQE